jgi:PIN domain nuclease of toxin-antitoxin system
LTTALLDTHAWAWSLEGNRRLSPHAIEAIDRADSVLVSPVSLYEIAQKVRLGKWPEMAPFIGTLLEELERQGAGIAPLDPMICLRAGTLDWSHRDPFDRLLAATAMYYGLPIISADPVFDGILSRIW